MHRILPYQPTTFGFIVSLGSRVSNIPTFFTSSSPFMFVSPFSTSHSSQVHRNYFSSKTLPSGNSVKMEIGVDGNIDPFSLQAKEYAKFRPRYPEEVFKILLQYAEGSEEPKKNGKLIPKTAVDIATGSGFMADQLSKQYSKVIGIDRSLKQLENAIQRENITYNAGSAYETHLPSSSADIVTVAQAIHWFELSKFFTEAKRVLKPNGVFAVLGYSVPTLALGGYASASGNFASPEVQIPFSDYYKKFSSYWDCDRTILDNQLKDIDFSSSFTQVERKIIPWTKNMKLEEFFGYLFTWSAYQTYIEKHSGEVNPMLGLRSQLVEALGSPDATLDVTWPFFVICCRKPREHDRE